jgi:hypothetical protein
MSLQPVFALTLGFVNYKKGASCFSEQTLFDLIDLIYCVKHHFQQYFSYIMATSFNGGRSQSTQREPPTMDKQLVNFFHGGCESSANVND